MTDKAPLHIYLFGDLRIVRGDEPAAPLNSARAQSLLAYMVLHAGVPQSRRHLAFLLWPDSSDEQARSNLRKLVHDLRRALPEVDRFLEAAGPNLLWRAEAPYTLDVAEFQSHLGPAAALGDLTAAVGLYQGPLFQSCYDDWILPERERLHQRLLDALARLIDLLEAQGEYRTAIHYGQLLLQHDPLHEDVYRTLMRLLALTDDRAAALRTYQTCAAVLREELDVEPSPATQQAYRRLLELQGPVAPVVATASPLVGHQREWSQLQAAWRLAAKGQTQWVALTGAPGIGKTRLTEELAGWATKQGLAVATARGYAAEAGLGYGPITTWLRSRPVPALDGVWLSEIARLLPELLVQHGELAAPGPLTEPWQRLRFFEALARTLLATQPLILVLDDLSFCDRDTVEWLHFLVRSNPQAALLVVSTFCLEDMTPEHPVQGLLATLRRGHQLTEIAVRPLTEGETGQLAAQVGGQALTEAQAERLYGATEGNPLFVLEMVRGGVVPGEGREWALPHTLHAVISARLQQLTPTARRLLPVAAVIGRRFTVEVLAGAAGLEAGALAQGLGELRQKRIVKAPVGSRYEFDHSQLQAVAYADLNPAERQLWHGRVAEALLGLPGAGGGERAAELVEHFEGAGQGERAVPYLVEAGDEARRRYANATALGYYRRALPRLGRGEQVRVLLKTGAVLELVGQWGEAEELYREALGVAEAEGDRAGHAEAQLELGELWHRKGADREAQGVLAEAQGWFEEAQQMGQVAHVLESRGLIYEWQGEYGEALACHEQALGLATASGDERGVSRALGNRGLVYWRQGEYGRALEAFQEQLGLAQRLGDHVGISRALGRLGLLYLEQSRNTDALDAFQKRLDTCTRVGDRLGVGDAMGQIGVVYFEQGNYGRALEQYTQQLQIAQELGASRGISQAMRRIGLVYFQRGDYGRARLCYARSLRTAADIGDQRLITLVLANLAHSYAAECNYAEAERLYGLWRARSRSLGKSPVLSEVLYHQAHMHYRQHNYTKAHSLLTDAARHVEETGVTQVPFKIQVLTLHVRHRLAQLNTRSVLHKLQTLIGDYPDDREQAALYYALWTINPQQAAWEKLAAKLYRRLYVRTPKWTYAERYHELTGRRLSPAPALPNLAPEPVDLDGLLKQISMGQA